MSSLLLTFLLSAGFASASHITRGDVQAAFRGNGGFAALSNGDVVFAAILEGALEGRINSFLFDGKAYCGNDWLVIYNGWATLGLPRREAVASLAQIENLFFLDGEADPLETIRTSVARGLLRFLGEFPEPVWAFREGHILAPGDLALGTHTLHTVVSFDGVVVFDITSTFFIVDCPD